MQRNSSGSVTSPTYRRQNPQWPPSYPVLIRRRRQLNCDDDPVTGPLQRILPKSISNRCDPMTRSLQLGNRDTLSSTPPSTLSPRCELVACRNSPAQCRAKHQSDHLELPEVAAKLRPFADCRAVRDRFISHDVSPNNHTVDRNSRTMSHHRARSQSGDISSWPARNSYTQRCVPAHEKASHTDPSGSASAGFVGDGIDQHAILRELEKRPAANGR